MSHYLRSTMKIRSEAALVAALRELGFEPAVHAEAAQLVGYHGDRRAERAHVVVPRAQLHGASNDLGFFRNASGEFELIASEFDRSMGVVATRTKRLASAARNDRGAVPFADWADELATLAGVHVDLETAASLGLTAERVDLETGEVDVYVYAQEG